MSLDFEPLILARLAQKCTPGIAIVGSLDVVDLTDETTVPVAAQVLMGSIDPTRQTGKNARLELVWSFGVHVDTGRATPAQKTAAWALLQEAGNALVGFEIEPGRELQIVKGEESGFNGRIRQLSFGFTVPAHFVGS